MARDGSNLDLLPTAHQTSGNGAVDCVRELSIAAVQGLHDGCGMNPGARAEGIAAQHRIVGGNLEIAKFRHALTQGRQVR